jgi:hypothetical protein
LIEQQSSFECLTGQWFLVDSDVAFSLEISGVIKKYSNGLVELNEDEVTILALFEFGTVEQYPHLLCGFMRM